MEILSAILSWVGNHWEYIIVGYLSGAAGNTNSGRWIVKLPIRPLKWVGSQFLKKEA